MTRPRDTNTAGRCFAKNPGAVGVSQNSPEPLSQPRESESPKPTRPPDYVLAFNRAVYPTFTGIWMGWRWINGKAVAKAPPVER